MHDFMMKHKRQKSLTFSSDLALTELKQFFKNIIYKRLKILYGIARIRKKHADLLSL